MKNSINILYVCDDNYAMQTGISILSLLENNVDDSFVIYVFELDVKYENRLKLQELVHRYRQEIIFIDAKSYIKKLQKSNLNTYRGSYSAAVRFGVGELLPDYVNRILYIDCDTLVVGRIKALYNYDLSTKVIGMCYDCIRNERKKRLHFDENEPYYNSGVLLIDLRKWKDNNLEQLFMNGFSSIKDFCYLPDQDGINILFKKYIMPLPFAANILSQCLFYNYEGNCVVYKQNEKYWYTKEAFLNGVNNPIIYHFCGHSFIRPWYKNSKHPFKKIYDNYYTRSPWGNEPQVDFKWNVPRYIQYITRGNNSCFVYLNAILQRIFIFIKYHV